MINVDAVTFQREAMRYERLLYRISYAMLRHNEDCADAVQETLLRAWRSREGLRSMDAFRPWLSPMFRLPVSVAVTP